MEDVIDMPDDGGPGRSRVTRRPSARIQARIERHRAALEQHEAGDKLIKTARDNRDLETLYLVREEVAREAAALLWTRLNTRPGSRDLGRIASRRVGALVEVARLTLEIARAAPGAASAAQVIRICELLRKEVEHAAAAVLDETTTARFVNELSRRYDGVMDVIVAMR